MAKKMGAGPDNLPGIPYQPNNGMAGGVRQSGWGQVPCNTDVYTGQPVSSYPDPNGSDPEGRIREFWPNGSRMGS
jgi:hypothetical protein